MKNLLRDILCALVAGALLLTVGCANDEKGTPGIDNSPRYNRTDDMNDGTNKNSNDLNKGNMLNQDVGPNYKMNGADNSPPR